MAAGFDLTTVANVKALLTQSSSAWTQDDTLISDLIAEFSTGAEELMGRKVETTSYTEDHDAQGHKTLYELGAWPVTSITSVKVATDWDFASADAVDSDGYHVDAEAGILYAPGLVSLRRGYSYFRAVQIVYSGGMAANQADFQAAYPDLVKAIDRQVIYAIDRRSRAGAKSVNPRGGFREYGEEYGWLSSSLNVIRRYGRLPIG